MGKHVNTCVRSAFAFMKGMSAIVAGKRRNDMGTSQMLGEDIDSWETMMFLYNSALKEEIGRASCRERVSSPV